jgi:Beta-galactosidase
MNRACITGLLLAVLFMSGSRRAHAADDLRPWRDYRVIMWIGDSPYRKPDKIPLFFQRLRDMGVNTAMVTGDADPANVIDNHFDYYVENIVNRGLCLKWNSNVRDWDGFVTKWAKSGRPDSALVRDYCLDDPQYMGSARKAMQDAVRRQMNHQPIAYNIRDELSITYSANPFDYDFNPKTLAAFREYLKTQYADLNALNTEWDTHFTRWEQIKPFTTDQIKNRMANGDALPRGKPDWQAVEKLKFDPQTARKNPVAWNLSPWVDFRSYMDMSLARTLDDLRHTAHQLDPHTPVGIEGAQAASAFGGYDLWRLSQSVDWIEPYDIGNSREILGSFMPGKPFLTTVFEKDTNHARRRLWHLLLEGDKGCIVWWSEDCIDYSSPDYALTAKAQALKPALAEMTSPLAKLFLRTTPEFDPIYIEYSQPSIDVDWLIESTEDGSTWLRRFSSYEADHNQQMKMRGAWLGEFEDLGFSPRFIASGDIENGRIKQQHAKVLVLPTAWAMSDREQKAIDDANVTVFADERPGLFDEHGKLRNDEVLTGAISSEASRPANVAAVCPIKPPIVIAADDHSAPRTRVFRYTISHGELLAFERNIDYQMSEDLKQKGGNPALENPVEMVATLPKAGHVYDLRTGKYVGQVDHFQFTLDPWQPSLFAVLPQHVEGNDVVAALLAMP